ncbi:MAG: DUF2848 domain-containing protein [Desulfotignum sp.]|nr:DUF2848 domain-containing protein [Desulfotignum sp.]MCF8090755.1 DUF2848 domain-containing protein [Desulfotignum sp.]
MEINVTLENKSGLQPLQFEVRRMVNAGYTGRNQEEVRRHIDELAVKGIPGPEKTPTLYPVIPQQLMVGAQEIEVFSNATCCEIEYVLLVESKDKIYVGLGSDHTDRKLEETDIPRAKQICPNLMTSTVWPLDEVVDHWDELIFRCRQTIGNKEELYQEGPLELIMNPAQLLDFVQSAIPDPLAGYAIFSGTIGNLAGGFVYGIRTAMELKDPILGRQLSLAYDIKPLDYLLV